MKDGDESLTVTLTKSEWIIVMASINLGMAHVLAQHPEDKDGMEHLYDNILTQLKPWSS